MNRKNWSNVFRVVLIIDSAIFVYKFALATWLFVNGIRDRKALDGRYGQYEEFEYSGEMMSAILKTRVGSIGSGFFVMLIFFRWFANVSQYRNEKRSSASKNLLKYFACGCCKACSWYIVSFLNVCMDGILILIDWTYSGWLTKVAVSCASWEIFIIFFMIAYKSIDERANPVAILPNTQRIDHQDAPPPYHIYANNNLSSRQGNDNQEAPPPPYQLCTKNVQQIN